MLFSSPQYILTSQRHRTGLKPLFNRLQNLRNPYKLVVNLSNDESLDADALSDFLRKIPFSVSTHTEITMGEEHLRHSVAQAVAKCRLQAEEQNRDPLAKARQVIRKRLPLLSGNGRLSAQAVAKTFGLSLSQLAVQIGRTKQALSKTPDSPRIQSLLRPYERIARLRAVFSDSNFKAWLEQPNSQLDDHSPMELVNTGRADVAADLVEDMLLGNPG